MFWAITHTLTERERSSPRAHQTHFHASAWFPFPRTLLPVLCLYSRRLIPGSSVSQRLHPASSSSTHLPRFSLISPPMRSCALDLFPSRCSPTPAASCDLCHPFVFIWEQKCFLVTLPPPPPPRFSLSSPRSHAPLVSSPPLPPPAAQPVRLAVCLSVLLRGTQRGWNFGHFSSPCFVVFVLCVFFFNTYSPV